MATSTLKTVYPGSGNFTITLASLGNSTTVGRQSTVIDNSTNGYLDYQVGGLITCGTNSSGFLIEVYAFAPYNDSTYPGPLGASDAGVDFANRDRLFESCVQIAQIVCEGTLNQPHYIKPTSVAQAFGGWMPTKFGIVVMNASNNSLNATGGNHVMSYRPIYTTVS